MKFYNVLLIVVLPVFLWAQKPTGNIQKDTALANQYYKEAVRLIENKDTTTKYLSHFEKTIQFYEAHPFDLKLIEIQSLYAYHLLKAGQAKKAMLITQKTVSMAEKGDVVTSPSMVYTYFTLSKLYSNKNIETSIDYGTKALESANKRTNVYFSIAQLLMSNYHELGKYKELQELIITLEKTLNETTDEALKKNQLFVYYGKLLYFDATYNFEKALLFGKKMLADNETYQLLNPNTLANCYGVMGYIHSDMGNHKKALEWVQQSKSTTTISEDAPSYGTFYNQLAWVYDGMGDREKAIQYYEKAIQSYLKDKENQQEPLSTTYGNLAETYLMKKNFKKAIECNQESRKYGTQTFHDYQLGSIYFYQKEYEKSVAAHHKALLQFCTQFSNADYFKSPSEYEVYKNDQFAELLLYHKGWSLFRLGEKKEDIDKMTHGLNLIEQSIKMKEQEWQRAKGFDISQYQLNSRILKMLGIYIHEYEKIYQLKPSDEAFDELFLRTQKRKAIQLMETLTPSLLPKNVFSREQAILKNIQSVGQQLDLAKNANNKDSIRYYQDKLLDINQQLEAHLATVKEEYPKESNHFYHTQYTQLKDIQSFIPSNTLLVSYNNYNQRGKNYNLILTVGKTTKSVKKVRTKNIKKKIKLLNELIQDRFAFQTPVRNEFIEVSHELYKALIQPIEAELEGKTRLMLVIEGELFYIPFELLLASNEKKPYHELDFLIKKYEINYNYSATAFLRIQAKQTPQDKSLFAFAPVFKRGETINSTDRTLDFMIDSLYRGFDKGAFAALPNTRKETNAIAKIVKTNGGKTNVLLEKAATKNNFNQQINYEPYQFVHIATHGLVNFKQPKLSAFACYAKDTTMESLVYANEIQFKDLNADLVVLSSCESGIGQLVAGEGLIALNRSFIYAGAKNVMFSLWKVSDKYSSELMIDFYKYYFESLENASYTSALRQAKLKMLSNPQGAVPKYWSAFVLMGE